MDSSYQSLSAFLPASCFLTCLDIAHYAFDTSENKLLEKKDYYESVSNDRFGIKGGTHDKKKELRPQTQLLQIIIL